MKRRNFFGLGGEPARRAARRAEQWLRPPFVEDETQFLLACTRCDKCIEACPHEVLFRLPARYGTQVADTPALDLRNGGCHLCADWPCVAACESEALRLPEGPAPAPKLARVAVDTESCLAYLGPECGACAHVCPIPGALIWEAGLRPLIDPDRCTGCALCREACIVEPKAITVAAYHRERATQEAS